MNLNFKISELTHSDIAVKNNINNMPDINSLDNLLELIVHILQPLREKYGPIRITSGYRNQQVNRLVNGKPNSNHTKGCAADIQNPNLESMYKYVINHLDYDECLFETNAKGARWLHVSYVKGKNRKIHNPNYKA